MNRQEKTPMIGERDCPSRETLTAFLLGKLSPEREEAINHHLETCAACEEQAQQIERQSDPLIDALRQPATASSPLRRAEGGGQIHSQEHPEPDADRDFNPLSDEPLQLEGYRILGEV